MTIIHIPDRTRKMQARGVSLRGVGVDAITLLARLEIQPLAYAASTTRNTRTNTEPQKLAPLMRHFLAELDREASVYRITDKGRQYLALLRKEGML